MISERKREKGFSRGGAEMLSLRAKRPCNLDSVALGSVENEAADAASATSLRLRASA